MAPPRLRSVLASIEAPPYRSATCRIGTHDACTESPVLLAPIALPLVYEVCTCPCHASPSRPAQTEPQR